MPLSFTPSQQAAIDCDAPLILVSAAAGSGKTAVLTERIMRHLRGGKGLDRLLVVTFTEAAAAGMKDKITEKLHDAMATEEGGFFVSQETDPAASRFCGFEGTSSGLGARPARFFARQAALLPGADISTIHAFCRSLVKAHFQQAGLDPAFRVGDEAELGLIKAQVMDELFEAEYSADNGFIDLVDVYGGKAKDDRLDTLVRKLYEFLISDPFPLEAAERYAAMFNDTDLDTSPWAMVARDELAQGLEGVAQGLERARALCLEPGGPDKYIERLERDIKMVRQLQAGLDLKFDAMYADFRAIDWGRLPSVSKKDEVEPELKDRVQRFRNNAKKAADKLVKGIFFAPPAKMEQDIAALAPRVRALMGLTVRFARAYASEKRARNLLDFADLEHFAIQILYPNGPDNMTPGPVAAALSRKYHEVLIDEYQDANSVQELILSAVSGRRFMVGDVKQSIYRFRRANPALFRRKYETYKKWGDEPSADAVRIDLSQNFRSRSEVLDGINFFFSRLMCSDVGEVDYDSDAALKYGADYPPWPVQGPSGKVRLDLLDEEGGEEETETSDATQPPAESPLLNETRMIAKTVHELLATQQIWDAETKAYRPCRLSDMVILTRSITNIAPIVIEELKNCGIPAVAEMGAGFFEQLEVKTVLSFLRVVDNPRQDIDLIAVLHSPVYGVSADELLQIRRVSDDGDFYDCVKAWEGSATTKLARFLSDLARFRAAAAQLPISRLIGLIYDITRYPAYAAALPGGPARLANLRLLLERAIAFEETRLTGLFHFTQYIKRLHDSQAAERVGAAADSVNENCLRLMTIHKSKGLEFPIAFVSFLGRRFNLDDETRPIILHGELGLGPNYVDTALRTQSNTLPRFSLQRLTRRENLSEELRCLYVAMTRAMQCLILTARSIDFAKDSEKWLDAGAQGAYLLPVYYRRAASRYLDWIMPCVLGEANASAVTLRVHKPDEIAAAMDFIEMPATEAAPDEPPAASPAPPAVPPTAQVLPSKLSISEIKRLYASDLTPDSAFHEDTLQPGLHGRLDHGANDQPLFEPPHFIAASRGLTAMRMGSVLHSITEHMDYHAHTTREGVESLIGELIEKNFITQEEAAAIDRAQILALAASPLAERIRKAPRLYREIPFVMAMPAGEIYPHAAQQGGEKILVHGIIDAYFEEDGQIVLIDFKSGHAAGADEKAFAARHAVQLNIYKKAVAQATAKEVKEVLLYSFSLGRAVSIM